MGTFSPIGGGLYLRTDAAVAFNLMAAAAKAAGVTLIPSGYRAAMRTAKMQASLVKERPGYAAPVGKSKHQIGICIDIDLVDDATGLERPAKAWLAQHAAVFGFIPNVAREPWHFEYVGFTP